MNPIAVPIEEFCRLAGGFKKTKAFALLRAGEVERVKIGRRTAVTFESIERFVARSTVEGGK